MGLCARCHWAKGELRLATGKVIQLIFRYSFVVVVNLNIRKLGNLVDATVVFALRAFDTRIARSENAGNSISFYFCNV